MSEFSMFNPMKKQEIDDIHHMLMNLSQQTDKEICIYNDNVGFYFNPLRSCDNVSLWLDDYKYYNLYSMLKDDIYLTKIVFKELSAAFHWDLISHFEERKDKETNPIVVSFILFCLHNLSDAQDDSFSRYNKDNYDLISEKIQRLDYYYIAKKRIYHTQKPEDVFIVSVNKEFEGYEGLLITDEKKKDYELIQKHGRRKIYYVDKESRKRKKI